MEIPGPCDVCQTPAVLHTCATCGRKVCQRHFVTAASACVVCAQRYGSGVPSQRVPAEEEPPNLPEPPPDAPGRLI